MKRLLQSSLFQTEYTRRGKWQLDFKKSKNSGNNEEESFSLFLKLIPEQNQGNVSAFYSLFIIGPDDKRVLNVGPSKQTFKPNHYSWGYAPFISKKRLFESKDVFLPNDQLTLGCELAFFSTTVFAENKGRYVSSKQKKNSLIFDIEEALNQRPSDVLIKVGDKEIQAHKFMLSARSVVFAAMFEHDTVERKRSCVEIKDVEFEVFEEFIQFIYTDTCPRLNQFAYELFILADRYNVENLKILAEEELANNLTVENVVRVLIQADGQNNVQLEDACAQFIAANFQAIPKDEDWNDLKNNHLQKIMSAFAVKLDKPVHIIDDDEVQLL